MNELTAFVGFKDILIYALVSVFLEAIEVQLSNESLDDGWRNERLASNEFIGSYQLEYPFIIG